MAARTKTFSTSGQGVAIAFFVKRGLDSKGTVAVRHAQRWGLRRQKWDWLAGHDLEHTDWHELNPESPSYLFVPRDNELGPVYQRYLSVSYLFPVNSVGIVTARDGLTIHWSSDEVWRAVTVFSLMEPELARQGYKLGKDVRDWRVKLAQKDLLDSGPMREQIIPILYRPFDVRYTYYTGRSRGFICRPRPEVMRQMLGRENLGSSRPSSIKTSSAP
jgi:hypothetical protein